MDNRVIIIDDEKDFLESLRRGLITSGFKNISTESDPLNAVSLFTQGEDFDIALIDVNMPDMSGIILLELIKKSNPSTECIMITAVDDARTAVTCRSPLRREVRSSTTTRPNAFPTRSVYALVSLTEPS